MEMKRRAEGPTHWLPLTPRGREFTYGAGAELFFTYLGNIITKIVFIWGIYDTGIRNALINNFNRLDIRQDAGALWENFLVSERMKKNHYTGLFANRYFWRTTAQSEIDYIEESDGKLNAYEFKFKTIKSPKFPAPFMQAYPDSITEFITLENFLDFVM